MNKQQFIEYIEKLPNEIDFTPMHVEVKAECPNPDGSYRTIAKNIKFECTYTDMVHKLEHTKENSKIDPLLISSPFYSSTESIKFQDRLNQLHLTLRDILKYGQYGDCPQEWGGIPIFVFAWNLLSCLRTKEDSFYETLHDEIKEVLVALGEHLSNIGRNNAEFELTTECLSLKLGDLLD